MEQGLWLLAIYDNEKIKTVDDIKEWLDACVLRAFSFIDEIEHKKNGCVS